LSARDDQTTASLLPHGRINPLRDGGLARNTRSRREWLRNLARANPRFVLGRSAPERQRGQMCSWVGVSSGHTVWIVSRRADQLRRVLCHGKPSTSETPRLIGGRDPTGF